MTANKTCAVQILLVALPRLMCCSLVCSAKRYAALPAESTLTPTNLPGSDLDNSSDTDIKPACGPPNPSGTPNLCALPTTISAPKLVGSFISVNASKSVVAITTIPFSLHFCPNDSKLFIDPVLVG